MKGHFFRRLLDNANDLIWAIDMEGKFIYINNNISGWGYKKEELIGKPLLSILNQRNIGKRDKKSTEFGIKSTHEMEILDKYGKPHTVIVNSSPFPDDNGNIIGMMGIIRDVTQVQRLEERLKNEERLASLGLLATGIAHEIRNPLSSVKMNLHILRERLNPAGDNLEHFKIAQAEVANLERVVSELLDYAKPAKLKLDYHDPHEIIDETVAVAATSCEQEEITIEKKYADDAPLLLVDKGKIHQALLNIILNAAQASPRNSTVTIETKTVRAPSKKFLISVADSGKGIKPEDLKFVFDPFFTTRKSGTGLGLPTVRNIMKTHDGDISIDSTPGEGTVAKLELPLR
jgi:PAS domain S-box-containing protein